MMDQTEPLPYVAALRTSADSQRQRALAFPVRQVGTACEERHDDHLEVPSDKQVLHITTLGRFDISLPGGDGGRQRLFIAGPQARLVLKCLLAAPDYRRPRDQLVDLLWPELDGMQAREALRQALSQLRRMLEPNRSPYGVTRYLGSDRETVWLVTGGARSGSDTSDDDASTWIDRQQFERSIARAFATLTSEGRNPPDPSRVWDIAGEALALYRGLFLPSDLDLAWTGAARGRCRRLWVTLMRRLAELAVSMRQLDRALLLLEPLVEALPDDESAAARLMRVQAASGQRGEALRTYESLCLHLTDSLDTRPMLEVQELAHTIRTSASHQVLLALL